MADIQCPEINKVRLMSDCLTCPHLRKEEDVSNIWCRYLIGRNAGETRKEVPINALRLQMEENIRKAEHMYKRGWVKIADSYSFEATKLLHEIRRRENAKKTS